MKGTYDIVYLNMSLHHIILPDGIVCTALKRLVGPSGTLIIRDHAPTQESDYSLLFNVHWVFRHNGFNEAHGNPCADYDKPARIISRLKQMGMSLAPEIEVGHKRCFPVRGPLKAGIWRLYARPVHDGEAKFVYHDIAYTANRLAIHLGSTTESALLLPRDLTREEFRAQYFPNRVCNLLSHLPCPIVQLRTCELPVTAIKVINAVSESTKRIRNNGHVTQRFALSDRELFTTLVRGFIRFSAHDVWLQSNMQFALGACDQVLPQARANLLMHDLMSEGLVEILPDQDFGFGTTLWRWTDKARHQGIATAESKDTGDSLYQASIAHLLRLVDDVYCDNY